MKTPTKFHLRRVALWASGFIAALLLIAFVFISLRIGAEVYAASAIAMQNHQGDRVEALMRYVEDTTHSLRERNRAVWALGQLGDRRALPVLRKHYSGKPCDHANALCQRELGKAIELLEGGVNATALVWRRLELSINN
jgi:hypothetical protein